MAAWERRTGQTGGETVPLARAWLLASAWFGDWLEPDRIGRGRDELASLFRTLGFDSPFWQLEHGR